eukprot:scaffold231191_cov40-Prasinocladus_malaysianus.AAC.3
MADLAIKAYILFVEPIDDCEECARRNHRRQDDRVLRKLKQATVMIVARERAGNRRILCSNSQRAADL